MVAISNKYGNWKNKLAEKCWLQTSYLVAKKNRKITEGLEEAISHIFKFDTLNFDNKYILKKRAGYDLAKSNRRLK